MSRRVLPRWLTRLADAPLVAGEGTSLVAPLRPALDATALATPSLDVHLGKTARSDVSMVSSMTDLDRLLAGCRGRIGVVHRGLTTLSDSARHTRGEPRVGVGVGAGS